MLKIPDEVRRKALACGASDWLEGLLSLIADLEASWKIEVGQPFTGGTEAYVAEAMLADGTPAVLKLLVPRAANDARHEITVLRIANGDGCAELLRHDAARSALLLERLGAPLSELGLPLAQRHEILCRLAARIWRPAAGSGLPSGADKGRWLTSFIASSWESLGRPCSERAVEHALACAARRIAAHDDERAVLVHGDVHEWNALASGSGFKLIDPDGLLAEAEYDLAILMREDPLELAGDGYERARWLAAHTGRDVRAIWEWGVVERVSTGLVCTQIDLQPVGREMLAAADRVSALAFA
jgi:streptomycin 6-kinase